ncbi:MAG: VWA domain-containing protein [Verrucomicrobiae bacterium]|nr:VWA domain-containing protein [Verrucomicrobiae bacterium]
MPKVRANKPLADVNLPSPNKNADNEVVVCFMPDPLSLAGEGQSTAALAIDASVSMRPSFGFGGAFGGTPNYVEMVARKLNEILCGVTKKGETHNIYWAMEPDGEQIEEIGIVKMADTSTAKFTGPKQKTEWGRSTKILPAIKYIVEKVFVSSEWTMGVIITDGIVEDDREAIEYCINLGKRLIAEGKENNLKLVLIGVGAEVKVEQLEAFDDMFEDTDLDIDLWSSGSADDMQEEDDILAVLFGELMSEETIVADSATVLDSKGNIIASFPDGLPGKFRFMLPKGELAFTIHTPRGDVSQDVSSAF